MKKKSLRKISFDQYIADWFLDRYNFDGKLKSNTELFIKDMPNRNPEQVANPIWTYLIWRHLNEFHYN